MTNLQTPPKLSDLTAVAPAAPTLDPEAWRYDSAAAMRHCGLDWTVSLRELNFQSNLQEDTSIKVKDHKALVRDSDEKVLFPAAGPKYVPLQNEKAFQFFDPFLHERDCRIITCGSFGGGRRIYIQAQISDCPSGEVIPGDKIEPFLLLAMSHDQSIGTQVRFCYQRVYCENTLRAALAEMGEYKSIRHTASMEQRLQDVQHSIDVHRRTFDQDIQRYRTLANRNLTTEEFRGYLETLFTKELKSASDRLDRTADLEDLRGAQKVIENYETTQDLQLDGIRGTAWAAFNAYTQFLSHQKSPNQDSRKSSLWLGDDSLALERAESLALSI